MTIAAILRSRCRSLTIFFNHHLQLLRPRTFSTTTSPLPALYGRHARTTSWISAGTLRPARSDSRRWPLQTVTLSVRRTYIKRSKNPEHAAKSADSNIPAQRDERNRATQDGKGFSKQAADRKATDHTEDQIGYEFRRRVQAQAVKKAPSYAIANEDWNSHGSADLRETANKLPIRRSSTRPSPIFSGGWTPAGEVVDNEEQVIEDGEDEKKGADGDHFVEGGTRTFVEGALQHKTVEELEQELHVTAQNRPCPIHIRSILHRLITHHRVQPLSRHYEALILSNCHPTGSAAQVGAILQEMEDHGVDINMSTFTAATQALAVHPCPSLFDQIIESINKRWLPITPAIEHAQVASLLRTGQTELASVMLDSLYLREEQSSARPRYHVPKYLYILFIQHLVHEKDYDAAMRFIYTMHDRKAVEMDISGTFWCWVLECAARDGDTWVTLWIWQDWVEKMRARPWRRTCRDVLAIAARDGLPWLAESVRETIEFGGTRERYIETEIEKLIDDKVKEEIKRMRKAEESDYVTDAARFVPFAPARLQYELGAGAAVGAEAEPDVDGTEVDSIPEDLNTPPTQQFTDEEDNLLERAYTTSETHRHKQDHAYGHPHPRTATDVISKASNTQTEIESTPDSRPPSPVTTENEVSTTTNARERRKMSERQIKRTNMWSLLRDPSGYGPSRIDPWSALGPRARGV